MWILALQLILAVQKEAPPQVEAVEGVVRRFGAARFAHSEPLTAIAFSPSGRLLATTDGKVVKIWDVASGRERRAFSVGGRTLTFSKDDDLLAIGGAAEITCVNPVTGVQVQSMVGHDRPVLSLAFSPDGRFLASGSDDATVRVWVVKDGTGKLKIEDHLNTVFGVAWSPDGTILASASRDDTIRLWSMPAGTPRRTLTGHGDDVRAIDFLPDGAGMVSGGGDDRLALGQEDCALRIWNLTKPENPTRLDGHPKTVQSLVLSKDGTRVVSGGRDGQIRVTELPSGRLVRSFEVGFPVKQLSMMPEGRQVAVLGTACAPQIWDLETGKLAAGHDSHFSPLQFLEITPDGKRLLAAESGGLILIWNPDEGKVVGRLSGHAGGVSRITVTRDGRRAATVGRDKTMRIWDLEKQAELARAATDYEWSSTVAWWPDDETVVYQPVRGELRLFSIRDNRDIRSIRGPRGAFTPCFLKDGKSAALSESNRLVRLWNLERDEFRELLTSPRQVHYLGLSQDGRTLIAGGEGCVLLDMASGIATPLPHLEGFSRPVFSADGRRFAYPRWDRPGLGVVELASGQIVRTYQVKLARMNPVVFLADGWTLAGGLPDASIGTWSFAPDEKAVTGLPLEDLWKTMAEGTPSEALDAMAGLASRGAVAFVKDRIRPTPDAKLIRELIDDLRGTDVERHKTVPDRLDALGGAAEKALETALAAETDKVTSERLRQALDYERGPVVHSLFLLRRLRAQEVLERFGSRECMALLRELAESAVSLRERADAQEAVRRLESRK